MKYQKLLAMLLAASTAFCLPQPVFAEEATTTISTSYTVEHNDQQKKESKVTESSAIALFAADENTLQPIQRTEKEMLSVYADLENRVKTALLAGDTVVDITDLNLNENLNPLYYFFAYSPYFPEELDLTFWTDAENNYLEISLENPLTPEQTSNYFQQVDTRLAFYQSLISDGMSEAEKALTIHDYLVTHTEYDLNYTKYEARDVFVNGKGTCQAYAMAYNYIMNSLGIDAYFSGAPGRGHCWSVLQIDGELYNVDCAFDDFYDNHELQIAQVGMASHKHFLQNDAGLTASGYTGSQADPYECSSDRFADTYWTDVTSPVVVRGDRSYFIVNDTLIERYNGTGFARELAAIQNEQGIRHSGLVLSENMLYYNSDTEVHRFSLTDEVDQLVYRVEASTDLLNGCVLDSDGVKVAVTQNPAEVGSIFSLDALTADGWHELESGQKMYYENHIPVMDQWKTISGKQYYFDVDGYLETNKWIGSKYVKNDGSMAVSEWIENKYFDADGNWDQTKVDQWKRDNKGWWYCHANGSYTRNNWEYINGVWYHFDNSGYMETNKWIGNYYVKADGSMAKSEWVDKNQYYVDANGVWDKTKKSEWRKDNKGWWYRHANGSYTRNGWEQIDGVWYHFDKNGYMETNKWIGNYYVKASGAMAKSEWVDGNKYYVNASGAWDKTKQPAKWMKDGNRWWYRHSDGSYTRNNWEYINGAWYHFDKNGYMESNKWIGDYYVKSDGKMATNCWIGKYYVGSDGKWKR